MISKYFIFVIAGINLWFLGGCNESSPELEPEDPEVEINWRETHTISELQSDYTSGAVISDTVIIQGIISSSDETGNVTNLIFLQDSDRGISVSVGMDNPSSVYPRGNEVFVLVTGLVYDVETNQLSHPDGALSEDQLADHVNTIDEDRTLLFEIVTDLSDIEIAYHSRLVKVYGIQFEEAVVGETIVSTSVTSNRQLSDEDGNQIALMVSENSSFASMEIPYKSGNIEGLLTFDGSDPVLIPVTVEGFSFTSERHSLFTKMTFDQGEVSLPYQVMFPKGYSSEETYPLVIFLHGAGERGTDNERQMVYGSQTFSTQLARNDYPAIVIFPQCPNTDMWSRRIKEQVDGVWIFDFPVEEAPNSPMGMVIDLTSHYIQNESVDPSRVYVMGLSMGGIGTLEYLYYAPELPAAAISIAGGHDTTHVAKYGNDVSIRLYHGSNDGVVPPKYSRDMITALDHLENEDAAYFEAEGRGHEWNYVLDNEEELLSWLWSKSR